MKSAIIDINIFLDLIKIQMPGWLFKIEFQIYTTQEIVDLLNENQTELLTEFIESGQLIVYRLSEKELEEVIALTASKALELADKSIAWLSIHLKGIVISGNFLLERICTSKELEVKDMIWFFDLLIEKQLINRGYATQKVQQLLKAKRRIHREKYEKKISEWADPAT